MESVRKDIECCFGIMKVRFKILAHPVHYMSRVSKMVCRVMRTIVCVVYLIAACRNTSEKSTTLFGHVVFCTTCFWLLMVQLNGVGFCAGNLCPNDEFLRWQVWTSSGPKKTTCLLGMRMQMQTYMRSMTGTRLIIAQSSPPEQKRACEILAAIGWAKSAQLHPSVPSHGLAVWFLKFATRSQCHRSFSAKKTWTHCSGKKATRRNGMRSLSISIVFGTKTRCCGCHFQELQRIAGVNERQSAATSEKRHHWHN